MTRRSPTIILLLNMKVNVANTPNLKAITKKNRIIINNNFHPDKKEKAENTKSVTHIAYQQNSFDGWTINFFSGAKKRVQFVLRVVPEESLPC